MKPINWVINYCVCECLKWRDGGVDPVHQAWKGCWGRSAASSQCTNIPDEKTSISLFKFSRLLYSHHELWKPDQISFLTLPCWHIVESHHWLSICYIKSLITLCYPPIWKSTLISCHSTIQCCQLTPFTMSILLVHTSLISPASAVKPLERNLVKKTHKALKIFSALTGYGDSPEHLIQRNQIIPINIGKGLWKSIFKIPLSEDFLCYLKI